MSNPPQMGLQKHLVASPPKPIHLCLLCIYGWLGSYVVNGLGLLEN